MYCGSCLRDNSLAQALIEAGVDIQLIPMYTPIRTDVQDVSINQVFFNGIRIYLQEKYAWFDRVPAVLDRILDQPWVLRLATRGGVSTDAEALGALTLSVLQGESGRHRGEVQKLVAWLAESARPQLVNLSNMLIAGCVPAIKQALNVPILITLQGDDVFLNALPKQYQESVRNELRKLARHVDGFLVFSRYYADMMSEYLGVNLERFHIVQLGIDARDFAEHPPEPNERTDRPPTIGYLARLCPEKGLDVLVDSFIHLKQLDGMEETRLKVAGWLGRSDRAFADGQFAKLRAAGLGHDFEYVGVVDRDEKIRFLRSLDLLSVPTTYREPKGIYVLEALAAGVPVVQPDHGAFPELLAATGGGKLVRPNDPIQLAETLAELLSDDETRQRLSLEGYETVHDCLDAESMANSTLAVYRNFLR